MKCPACMQNIKQKIKLFPSESNNIESPMLDCFLEVLGNLNKVLFDTHSEAEWNCSVAKITAANENKRQKATFVAKLFELNANLFRMNDEFWTLVN